MLAVGVASFVLCDDLWSSDTSILVITAIFPLIGYLAGFIITVIARQPWNRSENTLCPAGLSEYLLCAAVLRHFHYQGSKSLIYHFSYNVRLIKQV